ncbi:hypothetical protein MFLAVUS_009512 [Mucor flavus]|uniref:Uncharacterized protein n=1 Tax=Mucor flavus TaxID=439312 RepID=A0ABP9ZA53_9FUNG
MSQQTSSSSSRAITRELVEDEYSQYFTRKTQPQVHKTPIEKRNNNTTNNETPTEAEPAINNQPTEPLSESEFRSVLMDIKDKQNNQIQQFSSLVLHISKSNDVLKQIVYQLQTMTQQQQMFFLHMGRKLEKMTDLQTDTSKRQKS